MANTSKGSDKGSGRAGADEDLKKKFREALERKHAHGGRDVSDGHDRSKVGHEQGAATNATQQMFRRKSG
ncbi:hypothetical protein SAMN05216199_1376 [Pedococcus cremeus]|jgi:hypothetical protein|uniref:DUF5302 domain-containing protein n=1 Tax=Pedococcus cremeus TaxID=587636 RepID=A0A1H9SYM9_9MICO|nr:MULTISPECIES: DUF5302 domain-containing protein [Intrasporangiaceae]TQJ50348.1 hypothetical protein FBY26_2048 [Phycicoccus sp. SLBN-51]SER90001.1 hypothetical protein SAMN05216199_1376 [Pedococcus cremeus]